MLTTQAAWAAGALSQALRIAFVRDALVGACVDELLKERINAKRQQMQQVRSLFLVRFHC